MAETSPLVERVKTIVSGRFHIHEPEVEFIAEAAIRVVLEAMREPSDAMFDAWWEAIRELEPRLKQKLSIHEFRQMSKCHAAMIDAAIKELT